MKRNLIDEITSIKNRLKFRSRYHFIFELKDIKHSVNESLDKNGDFDDELIKYIPIATVTGFEAFFRSVYKELIDFGEPFRDNAIKFNKSKNIKLDFDIINAIQTKTVTIGEFISHVLPCNNFDDINSNLSTIIDIDFTDQIKKYQSESISDTVNGNSTRFIQNSNQIIADIKRIFELRHIFCHEFATNIKIDKDEILRCFDNSIVFLNQINDFIWDILYPEAPESQTEMNIHALETFKQTEKELSELIISIKEASKEFSPISIEPSIFESTIEEWKRYREVKAKSDASPYEGGSMQPLVYANSLCATTKEKIDSLKNEYEYELRRYANR